MADVRRQITQLARVPYPVLFEGGTGTGKTLAARVLHALSTRRDQPFVECRVSNLAHELAVDALRGHRRGAFTGAVGDRRGVFELAHGGTLFLDEVGTATPDVQLALLDLVERRIVTRLGDERAFPVDVRLIFATNEVLATAVGEGRFREDLFWRLGQHRIQMPPLAGRRGDIPELVDAILTKEVGRVDFDVPPLSAEHLATLVAHDWPGNVRELEGVLQHYVTFGTLPAHVAAARWQDRLDAVLEQFAGNRSRAAEFLGISRPTLRRELQRRGGSSRG
jgi:DNA-binding NtrC family response regulator